MRKDPDPEVFRALMAWTPPAKRPCGHPLGTTRWCPDCAEKEERERHARG